ARIQQSSFCAAANFLRANLDSGRGLLVSGCDGASTAHGSADVERTVIHAPQFSPAAHPYPDRGGVPNPASANAVAGWRSTAIPCLEEGLKGAYSHGESWLHRSRHYGIVDCPKPDESRT